MENDVNLLKKYIDAFSDAVENYHYANSRLLELYGKMLDARKDLEDYMKGFEEHGTD